MSAEPSEPRDDMLEERFPESRVMAEADADGLPLIDAVLEQAMRQMRRGELVDIAQYCHDYPDLADELRPSLRAMVFLESPLAACSPQHTPKPPSILDDYLIIGELGKGSMGVVYEAIQRSLRRRVALKVIHKLQGNDRSQLVRFQREAVTAASLNHPNIVPVFGSGEDDAYFYYAMQLIDGVNLQQLLCGVGNVIGARSSGEQSAERPSLLVPQQFQQETDVQAGSTEGSIAAMDQVGVRKTSLTSPIGSPHDCAQIVLQVAQGLAFAHENGVIHRDIKPSNIMLDADRRAWIADFGLAKPEEGADLTSSGHVVGTLRYLPPEGFHGEFGPRGDIYSLGLTLFELLEGRPARTSNGQPELIRQAFHDPLPKLSKQLPVDLKTICYKCIEREPSDRYPSAAALADDLSRFLGGRPIASRRLGLAEKSVRWCRRHPTIVALAISLLLVSVIGIAVAERLSSRAIHLAAEAKANFEQAERNLGLVLNTVDQFCATFGADHRLDRPEFKHLKDQLLQATVELNETFVGNPAMATKAKLQLARIHMRLASLMMGQQTLAEVYDELSLAQALLLELSAANEDWYEVQIELIRCERELAHNRHLANELESAEQFYRASLNIADAMTEAGKRPSPAAEKARTLRLFGEFLADQMRFDEAELSFREARALYVAQSDEAPLEPSLALELALVDRSLAASYLTNIRNWKKAEQPLLDSTASFEQLMAEPTRSPKVIALYAEMLGQQAKFFHIANQRQQAVAVLEHASELLSELFAKYETVVDYRFKLATSLRKLADALSLLDGQDARVMELLERAAELQSQIVLNDPNNSLNVLTFASTLLSQADVLTANQDYDSALAKADRTIQLLDDLLKATPEHPLAMENRHFAGVKRAECLTELGRFEESFDEWERAIQLAPPMLTDYTIARAARSRILAGQYVEGTQRIDKLSAENEVGSSPQMQVLAACAAAYALAARQAWSRDDAAQASLGELYAQRAIALLGQWLQRTQQSGVDAQFIHQCSDFDCLREREDFRSLLNSSSP